MSPEHAYRASDPPSGLEAGLTILQAADGGAVAIEVELHNPSDARDVILRIERTSFITLTVADDAGTVLTRPIALPTTADRRPFELHLLAPGASQTWRVPLADHLDASAIPADGLTGRLIVNVALWFALRPGEAADDAFEISIVTLHDMATPFTRAALAAHK